MKTEIGNMRKMMMENKLNEIIKKHNDIWIELEHALSIINVKIAISACMLIMNVIVFFCALTLFIINTTLQSYALNSATYILFSLVSIFSFIGYIFNKETKSELSSLQYERNLIIKEIDDDWKEFYSVIERSIKK